MHKTWIPALALVALAWLGGCTNPDVPAGHEGYIHHVPLMFGKMEYRGALPGPASTGVSWRLFTTNINMREDTYREDFELLTHDDLKVSFEVNTRISLRSGSVREIVEQWGAEKWYDWNVREPLRTIVRREVMKVSAADIQLQTESIGKRIREKLNGKYENTPIMIRSVDIGQFEFPQEVTEAIQLKIAKQQELERQQFILEKAQKEAAIRVLEALKLAKKQKIISATLDPLYVQWRAVQVYRTLATSPNKTVLVLPSSTEGAGLPLVLTTGKPKRLSAEDEEYLAEMEKQYMSKVSIGASAAPPATDGAAQPATDGAAQPATDGAAQPATGAP